MELVLIVLSAAGLAGCLGAALRVHAPGRGLPGGCRLQRPRASAMVRERAA